MHRVVELSAAYRGAYRDLPIFSGEAVRFDVSDRAAGAEVVVTVAPDHDAPPAIEATGQDRVDLTAAQLAAVPEGGRHVYNIWLRDDGALILLMHGRLTARPSVVPLATAPEPLALSGAPTGTPQVGVAFSFVPELTGGTPPHVFDLAAGVLPAGLTLDPATGEIAGVPTQVQAAGGVILRVSDAGGDSASLPELDLGVRAPPLAPPASRFTTAQASFDETAHIDFRDNWQVSGGRLTCTGTSGNDARLTLDTPLVAGRPCFTMADVEITAGDMRFQLGGDGFASGGTITDGWTNSRYFAAAEVTGDFPRVQIKPSTDFAGSLDDIALYDLSTVDPHDVACDVIIVGGDSNSCNATSGYVTATNRETAFDPRIWYMPHLRSTGSFDVAGVLRHVPRPCVEPVAAVEARRMSPVHAVAGRLVGWSAARGRPLLVMALGDPGSGLMNTEDWRRGSTVATTGARMWTEMVAMKAAVEALEPAHEIVGMVWSLGANDLTGAGYDFEGGWLDVMGGFVSDLRAHVADVPMVLWSIGEHFEPSAPGDGRGAAMLAAQQKLDQGSGDIRALDRFRVVVPATGHALSDQDDPHFDAQGMQRNGRDAGDALLGLL